MNLQSNYSRFSGLISRPSSICTETTSKQNMKRGRLRAVIEYEPKAKYICLPTSVEIPTDCLFSIFQFCGPATFIHISPLVCKEWYAVTNEEHNWKTLCLYEWPMLELTDQSEWKMTWKELFLHYTAYLPPQM